MKYYSLESELVQGTELRRGIMKRTFFVCWILTSLLAVSSSPYLVTRTEGAGPSDQELQDFARGMGVDPKQCDDLQNKINQIVAIYESPLSDKEKMASLSELATKSIEEMKQAASKDSGVATAINQHLILMQSILSAAQASASRGEKTLPDSVKDDVKKMKILTKTYVDLMKGLCPKLALPDVVTK
jgi:hypothetical protein